MRIVFAACTFVSSLAMSQEFEDTLRTYYQSPVVVSASRVEQRLQDVARNVSVVTSEHLAMSLYYSLADALAQEHALYVVGTGQNYGMLQSFFLRGAANNQTAVLIDGVRMTDPSTVNNAIDGSELSLAGVERIEIVRGPHSTFFGSSAIGGVVNIISQSPTRAGVDGFVSLSGGYFGPSTSLLTQEVKVSFLDASGFFGMADVLREKSQGQDATVDTVTNPAVFKKRDRDDFEKVDIVTRFGYRSVDWDVFASYRQGIQHADLDREAFVDDDNYTLSFQRRALNYGSSLDLSDGFKLRLNGGYSEMNRDAVNDSSVINTLGDTDQRVTEDHYTGSTAAHELQCEFDVYDITGVVGVGVYSESMNSRNYLFLSGFEKSSSTDTLHPSSATFSLFANATLRGGDFARILRPISVGIGVRALRNGLFGGAMTFDLNPALRLFDGALVFANYSRGFNAPSLYQLFSPEQHYISAISRGNTSLKPEESRSFEFGVKLARNDVHLTASVFHVETDNLIEYVYLWNKSIGLDTLGNDWLRDDNRGDTYLNVGRQVTRGIELRVDVTVLKNISVSGNLTVLEGTLSYSPADIDTGKTHDNHLQLFSNGAFLTNNVDVSTLVRRPNTANLTLRYQPYEEWSLMLNFRSVGRRNDVFYDFQLGPWGALGSRQVDAYFLVDFSQRLEISENLVLRAKVENIFNTQYSEIRGFTTRGRGVYLGMQYSIR